MPDSDLLRDEDSSVEILDSEVVFEGRVHTVVREHFAYNDETLMREYVRHPGAVAVLALDDDDNVLLIQQYRHPIRARDWELPAGLLDVESESLLAAAQRELAEEVDLEAREWFVLADVHTSPGGTNEFARVFLARGLTATPAAFAREAEEADIVIRWVPLDELVAAIGDGRVRNSLLVVGGLAAFAARASTWSTLRPADDVDMSPVSLLT